MAITRWTDEKVKAARLPEGSKGKRFRVEPGLYLYVRPRAKGAVAKQWQYRAQVDEVRKWLSLGSYPAVSLAAARAELSELDKVRQSARKGEANHPAIEAQIKRKTGTSNPTVTEAFELWVAEKRKSSRRKGGAPVRERTIQLHVDPFEMDIKPEIGDIRISSMTPAAARLCIDRPLRRGSPGAAAHVYKVLRGLVNFAITREFVTGADPMRGVENPRPYRPAKPNAAFDKDIVAILHALSSSEMEPSLRWCIEFALLTGLRSGECRKAEWTHVDWDRRHLNLPSLNVKTDEVFRVHLSDASLKVLKAVKDYYGASRYVFPGRGEGKMLGATSMAQAMQRKHEQGAVEKYFKPHDLRKTFRTMLSRLDINPDIAGLCMHHTEKETMRKVYDGADYWPRMVEAWDQAGEHIEKLRLAAPPPTAANVVAFTQASPKRLVEQLPRKRLKAVGG